MKIEVKAVEMTDIREKNQRYIVLGEGANKVIIWVNEKNFQAVKNLTTVTQPELPLITKEVKK